MDNDSNLDLRRDHWGESGMSHITERPQTDGTAEYGCQNGHHAVCQNRRIYMDQQALSCECRCHSVHIVICATCGAEVDWEKTNEHTRTHK